MKKESLFFLVMVIMAAVIAGATIGIVCNFDTIVNRINIMNSEAKTQSTEVAEGVSTDSAPADTETADPASSEQPAAIQGTSAINAGGTATTSNVMVVTNEEKAEITEMLYQLGMPQGGDYNQFIKQLQQQESIPATGSLDSRTLRVIINKTTEREARESML